MNSEELIYRLQKNCLMRQLRSLSAFWSRRKLISPLFRGGRRTSSSAFLSRRPLRILSHHSQLWYLHPNGQTMVLWFQSDLLKVIKV